MKATLRKINVCFDPDIDDDFSESVWKTYLCHGMDDTVTLADVIKSMFPSSLEADKENGIYDHITFIEFIYTTDETDIGIGYIGFGIYEDDLWTSLYGTDMADEDEDGDAIFNILLGKDWDDYVNRFPNNNPRTPGRPESPNMPEIIKRPINSFYEEHEYLIEHCGICYWM